MENRLIDGIKHLEHLEHLDHLEHLEQLGHLEQIINLRYRQDAAKQEDYKRFTTCEVKKIFGECEGRF